MIFNIIVFFFSNSNIAKNKNGLNDRLYFCTVHRLIHFWKTSTRRLILVSFFLFLLLSFEKTKPKPKQNTDSGFETSNQN
jgi:uncharacterized membrane protein